jgi:hypothetical protein
MKGKIFVAFEGIDRMIKMLRAKKNGSKLVYYRFSFGQAFDQIILSMSTVLVVFVKLYYSLFSYRITLLRAYALA